MQNDNVIRYSPGVEEFGMSAQNRSGSFQGAGELELYYQSWHPQALVRAVLVVVHGHGGHSGIFTRLVEYLVEYLVDRDYVIYSFDLRGHGRSPGQRGYINSWAEYRADLAAFLKFVKTKESQLPLFLIAQSMGGTIALDYLLRESPQIQGSRITQRSQLSRGIGIHE